MSEIINSDQARLKRDWEDSDNPVRRALYRRMAARGAITPPDPSADPLNQYLQMRRKPSSPAELCAVGVMAALVLGSPVVLVGYCLVEKLLQRFGH